MSKRMLIGVLVINLILIVYFANDSSYMIMENTKYATSYHVIRGSLPGPTVFIIAGIHGNEAAGIEAAEFFINQKLKKGKVVILPKANRIACNNGERTPYYMQDLNRVYPGKEEGTDTEKLAYEITRLIRRHKAAVVIDLHESAGHYSEGGINLGNSLIFASNQESIEIVMKIIESSNRDFEGKDRFTFFDGAPEGSINKEISNLLQIPVITIETNMKLPLEKRIEQQKYMIYEILNYYGMGG